MPYRLPLELELTILELAAPPLAAPPLAIDSLHDRVAFFITVSLVHRTLTAWAQERLHDQLLYTCQPRPDEHERLKTRLEAGFGRDRPLRRLYLDLSELPQEPRNLEEPGTLSVSFAAHQQYFGSMSVIEGPRGPEEADTGAKRTSKRSSGRLSRRRIRDPRDARELLGAMSNGGQPTANYSTRCGSKLRS